MGIEVEEVKANGTENMLTKITAENFQILGKMWS
jgi:hypothetical protein